MSENSGKSRQQQVSELESLKDQLKDEIVEEASGRISGDRRGELGIRLAVLVLTEQLIGIRTDMEIQRREILGGQEVTRDQISKIEKEGSVVAQESRSKLESIDNRVSATESSFKELTKQITGLPELLAERIEKRQFFKQVRERVVVAILIAIIGGLAGWVVNVVVDGHFKFIP